MDIFLRHFKQKYKTLALEYGFKSCGKAYYRVRNDVVQYFLLHRWAPYGRSCTIDFDVLPLCIGIDKGDFKSANKDIIQLMGITNWWEYDSNNEESILVAINKMFVATKDYLIPFFENAVDSASAYKEICNFEKKIYTAIPGGIIMNDYAKVCFTIKIGDYDKTLEHLKAAEFQNRTLDTQTLVNLNESDKQQYVKRHNAKLNKIRQEIEMISGRDMGYINEFILKNEEISLGNLCRSQKK